MKDSKNKKTRLPLKIFKIFFKVVLWVIGIPLTLIIVVIIALQFSSVQLYVTNKTTDYLSNKIKSKVALASVNLAFPKSVAISGLYVEDQNRDTLVYAKSLKIDINLWDLLSKKIQIKELDLDKLTGHISRMNEVFNFDYIIKAFDSGAKPTVKDTTASPWKFSLGAVRLKDIYFTFDDQSSGTQARLVLGKLDVEMNEFNLAKKKIHVKSIELYKTFASVILNPVDKEDTSDSEPFNYDLAVSSIKLDSVKFIYRNKVANQDLDADLGKLLVTADKIDLIKQNINLKQIALSDSKIIFNTVGSKDAIDPEKSIRESKDTTAPVFLLTLKKLTLKNNSLSYNDNGATILKTGIDYKHLALEKLNLEASDLYLSPEKIKLDLKQLSLNEKSGLRLKNFKGNILYDDHQAKITGLNIETSASSINADLGVTYTSLSQLTDSIGKLGLHADFNKTNVALSDVLYFVPGLFNDTLFNGKQNTAVRLNGQIDGTIDALRFQGLEIKTLSNTSVALKGSVKNIREPQKMFVDLQSLSITGSEKDIYTVLSKKVIPDNIHIPETFAFKGAFRGYLKNFDATLDGKTSFGDLAANIKMKPDAGNIDQPYKIEIALDSFDPGKLLNKSELLGPVTMTAGIDGSGLDFNNLNADLAIKIKSAVFKKYDYKDLIINGKLADKGFTGKININDKNIAFDYDGTVSFDPSKPNYVFKLDLKGVDLKALNLSDEDLRVSALISADIHDRNDKNFTGRASINNALIIRDNKKYPLDSLVFISEIKEGVANITLRSDILSADFKGDITLNQLPASLQNHFNTYFKMQTPDDNSALNPQKFDFELKVTDPSLLTKNLVPNLETLTPFSIKGNFDSQAKMLDMKGNIPQVIYSGIKTDSLRFDINSDGQKLSYSVGAAEISNTTVKFENLNIGGEMKNNTLSFQFNTNKDDSAKTIAIGGIVSEKDKVYTLKLNQELFLNAEQWAVDPANSMSFGGSSVIAKQLVISKGNSSVGLNSLKQSTDPPLEIKFTNFDIATLSKLIENNEDLASGNINGNVILEKQNGASAFRSDLAITNLIFKSVPIGTLKLKADNLQNSQKYDVNLGIEGNGNDIQVDGSYFAAVKKNNLDFKMDVRNINLATIEPFTFGQVTRMTGGINGKLNIKGSTATPDITGDLYFKETAFRPKIIDSYLVIHDGKVNFASNKIVINNLAIFDSLDNKATVNGFVNVADMKNLTFDMQLKTNNFLALNTTRDDNPLYFGTVYLDSDIRIRGNAKSPQVNVKAKLNKGSFITYVKPVSVVGKNESKGVVEFTDSLYRPGIMTRTNDTLKMASDIRGLNLDASINFDKSVVLKMLVDQESGDSLYIMGGGSLDFTLDESGKTTLTGKYNINDGGYHLAISDVVKRNFKIEKGSSVTWSGDVVEPYVDLKAIYVIKTSPIDLVQDELVGMTELERNKYRNLLTFYVYLKMTGFVSAPEISFDIQLAPDDRGALNGSINSKLGQLREDETALNKQVFALLTVRRFIGDNPLDNGNEGGGLSSASRSSASKVLTQQLNGLSDKYINFVDLDLGVNSFEDYSTGVEEGRTQLQVGVSKQLLNSKVTVRVGGNVELEGERAKQNNANDVAGNISIDYKLTDDGRYKLKAFRENQYENPIEGELTKTGAGIMYVRNFKRFRELLKKPASRNTQLKDEEKDKSKDD